MILLVGLVIGISHTNPRDKNPKKEETIPVIEDTYVDELRIPLIELDSLNPLKTRNYQVFQVLSLIYEPLFEYDSEETFGGVLAKSFSKLDAKTWIITLRNDVTWHGGEVFNAYDVIATIKALQNHSLVYSANVENIENVERLDGSSVKITLKEDDDFFVNKLVFPIIPEYYLGGSGFEDENKEQRPIGTGPYAYDKTLENGNIVLQFNENWWKQKNAKLQTITLIPYATYGEAIKGFKSAKVDMMVTNMAEWKNKFGTIGLNHYDFENAEFEVIIPNCQNIILKDMAVRRAILEGINRENIINSVYDDNAVISDMGLHTNSHSSITNFEYDTEKAKQLLMNANWMQGESTWYKEIEGKKYELSFSLLVNKEDEKKMEVAQKIKDDLEELGIHIKLKAISLKEIKEAISQDAFELALVSLDIKGEEDLIQGVTMNHKRNFAHYSSTAMENVIEKIKTNTNVNRELMDEFWNRYKSEVPYIGLYYKTSTILTNKSVKGNFNPNWFRVYRNMDSFCK